MSRHSQGKGHLSRFCTNLPESLTFSKVRQKFRCDNCGYTSPLRSNILRHMKIHQSYATVLKQPLNNVALDTTMASTSNLPPRVDSGSSSTVEQPEVLDFQSGRSSNVEQPEILDLEPGRSLTVEQPEIMDFEPGSSTNVEDPTILAVESGGPLSANQQEYLDSLFSKQSLLLLYGAGCSPLPQVGYEENLYGMDYQEMHSFHPRLHTDLEYYKKWLQAHAKFKRAADSIPVGPFEQWVIDYSSKLKSVINQNVDGLAEKQGIEELFGDQYLSIHGSYSYLRCWVDRNHSYLFTDEIASIFERGEIVRCPMCEGEQVSSRGRTRKLKVLNTLYPDIVLRNHFEDGVALDQFIGPYDGIVIVGTRLAIPNLLNWVTKIQRDNEWCDLFWVNPNPPPGRIGSNLFHLSMTWEQFVENLSTLKTQTVQPPSSNIVEALIPGSTFSNLPNVQEQTRAEEQVPVIPVTLTDQRSMNVFEELGTTPLVEANVVEDFQNDPQGGAGQNDLDDYHVADDGSWDAVSTSHSTLLPPPSNDFNDMSSSSIVSQTSDTGSHVFGPIFNQNTLTFSDNIPNDISVTTNTTITPTSLRRVGRAPPPRESIVIANPIRGPAPTPPHRPRNVWDDLRQQLPSFAAHLRATATPFYRTLG
jgi:NAD-dependent SIR2 family protein deacetylase